MWNPFMSAAEQVVPKAKIVHDKSHVAKIINKGFDNMRKREDKKQVKLKNAEYKFLRNRKI